MAKVKSDHVLVDKTFTTKGQLYRVQDVQGTVVYASKMIDDKTCQRGRPSKFVLSDVMTLLGVSLASLEAAAVQAKPVKAKPKPEDIVEETALPVPVKVVAPPTEEELEAKRKSLANLLAMFPDNATSADW
jgi:hypothetical protein